MVTLKAIWQVIKSLPALLKLISAIKSWLVTEKKNSKQKQNEEITKEVENAKTPEEKQQAVENVADRWGSK